MVEGLGVGFLCSGAGPWTSRKRVPGLARTRTPKRGFEVATQVALPVVYEDRTLEVGYRIDLVVKSRVVIEVKSLEAIHPIHEAQLLSYMRLSKIPIGLLIDFNVLHVREGIQRMVDGDGWQN